jgi:hypothetical protein
MHACKRVGVQTHTHTHTLTERERNIYRERQTDRQMDTDREGVNKCLKRKIQVQCCTPLIPVLKRQINLCEIEITLIYIVSSRPAGAAQ